MRQTLLLDSTYYPLQMIDWKKALALFFTERAEVVEHHLDVEIKSPNQSYRLPKVMRLLCKVGDIRSVKFNRLNVFYRDNFICQYCQQKFRACDLTMDHVYPKSRGGATDWHNIVTACAPCNGKKADKLLHETKFKLKRKPFEPMWVAIFLKKLTDSEMDLWSEWFG